MKSVISRLSTAPYLLFPLIIVYRKKKKATIAIILLLTIGATSCYKQFYRSNTKYSTDTDMLQKLQASNKYFILHLPERNIGLISLSIKNDIIEATEVLLPPSHTSELNPKTERVNSVKKSDKDSVLMEVHLYSDKVLNKSGGISLAISDIKRIDVYEFDKNATRSSFIISTVGIVIVSSAIIGLIALASLATTCNCPQVYVENNGAQQFNGGMYSGAVYSTLERTDYMPLPLIRTRENKVKLSIANAPNEEQFINSVQLFQVGHSSEEKVLLDRHGKIHAFKEPQTAFNSTSGDKKLSLKTLLNKDKEVFSFDNAAKPVSAIELQFKRNSHSKKAKLVINARNSDWSGHVFKEFSRLFGESADKWREKQEKADPETMEKWQKEQALPVMVYIKDGNSWKYVDYFPLTGNTASRDMIMEIVLPETTKDIIELKLETVYRFWDLDYAGLDFSENNNVSMEKLNPVTATTLDNNDQTRALLTKDKIYTNLKNNDAVKFEFSLPPAASQEVSYFLVSSGFYHNLSKYEGKIKAAELLPLKSKGGFNAFSIGRYQKLNDELARYVVKNKN